MSALRPCIHFPPWRQATRQPFKLCFFSKRAHFPTPAVMSSAPGSKSARNHVPLVFNRSPFPQYLSSDPARASIFDEPKRIGFTPVDLPHHFPPEASARNTHVFCGGFFFFFWTLTISYLSRFSAYGGFVPVSFCPLEHRSSWWHPFYLPRPGIRTTHASIKSRTRRISVHHPRKVLTLRCCHASRFRVAVRIFFSKIFSHDFGGPCLPKTYRGLALRLHAVQLTKGCSHWV